MKIPTHDVDLWYESYNSLNDNEKIGYIAETLQMPLCEDFIEEADFVYVLIETYNHLEREKQYEKMFELYNGISVENFAVLKDELFYLEADLVDYCLYLREIDRINQYMRSFRTNPVNAIDFLIPLVDKLNFYGQLDLAMDISESVYPIVKDAEGLMRGAESDFANTVLMHELQNLYLNLKNGHPVNREEILSRLNNLGYELNDEYDHIVSVLSIDGWKASEFELTDFNQNKKRFNNRFMLLFCKYLLEEKDVNFVAGNEIWHVAINVFQRRHPVKTNDYPINDYFLLDEKEYERELTSRLGFMSNKTAHGFAAAYGMHYVYDFLSSSGVISEETYTGAIEVIKEKRILVLSVLDHDAWKNGFVFTWEKPTSISPMEFENEKALVQRSFREKINIKDELPKEYIQFVEEKAKNRKIEKHLNSPIRRPEVKVGRNDLCPCGSGKKYKKCCLS